METTKYQSKIFIHTSSHGLYHRHLPKALKRVFHRHSPFIRPKIYAKSGQRITEEVVHKITLKAIEIHPRPQIHFVLLGDNNLRPNRRDCEDCFDTLPLFRDLVKNFSNFGNCRLVLCSILPSPLTDEESKTKFKRMNRLLNTITLPDNHRISFLNLTNDFIFQGIVQEEILVNGIVRPVWNRDGIHLTVYGATMLARRLMEFLRILPVSFENFPSQK